MVNEIDGTISSMTQDDTSSAGPIDEQVDNLVTDASQASESFEVPSIDELDARLATAADDEMDFEGEFESTAVIDEPDPIDELEPIVQAAAPEVGDQQAETDEVEGDFEAPAEQATVDSVDEVEGDFEPPAQESPSTASSAAGAPSATDEPPAESAPVSTGEKTRSVDVAGVASGVALGAAKMVSIPLARASRAQRDTIGWVALNTIFLAMCVWLYVLLIR